MPSGPKKRRAASRKNDTNTKTSTDPAAKEEVAAVEAVSEMAKGDEDVPIMESEGSVRKESESVGPADVHDSGIVKQIDSVSTENLDIPTKEDQDSLKGKVKTDVNQAQNEDTGQEKMLEQLLLISSEISCIAEKQLSLVMKLSQLLGELKGSKRI